MEKVAILNDIHGNLFLLNKALDYLKDKKLNILNLFNDRPPRIIYKVEKKDD